MIINKSAIVDRMKIKVTYSDGEMDDEDKVLENYLKDRVFLGIDGDEFEFTREQAQAVCALLVKYILSRVMVEF